MPELTIEEHPLCRSTRMALVTCQEAFDKWYNRQAPNPNVLEGAIVSGPDQGNNYGDFRYNFQQAVSDSSGETE